LKANHFVSVRPTIALLLHSKKQETKAGVVKKPVATPTHFSNTRTSCKAKESLSTSKGSEKPFCRVSAMEGTAPQVVETTTGGGKRGPTTWTFPTVYATPDGESHFGEKEVVRMSPLRRLYLKGFSRTINICHIFHSHSATFLGWFDRDSV